jgi:hypothetical protein
VLICISSFCLMTVVGALASLALGNELFAVLCAGAVVSILIVTRVFGYAEFLLVKKSLAASVNSFWSKPFNGRAHQIEVRLQGTADWKELWDAITTCADQLNLKIVRLDVNAPSLQEGYHARWERDGDDEDPSLWRAEIPVGSNGHTVGRLLIAGQRDLEAVYAKVARMEELVGHFETAAKEPARSQIASLT